MLDHLIWKFVADRYLIGQPGRILNQITEEIFTEILNVIWTNQKQATEKESSDTAVSLPLVEQLFDTGTLSQVDPSAALAWIGTLNRF